MLGEEWSSAWAMVEELVRFDSIMWEAVEDVQCIIKGRGVVLWEVVMGGEE